MVKFGRIRVRRPMALVLAAAFGVMMVGAAASSLNLDADGIGSSNAVVAPCDDGTISVRFGGIIVPDGQTDFVVNEVVFNDVAEKCNGTQFHVTVFDSSYQSLNTTSGTLVLDNGSASITLSGSGGAVPLTEAKGIAAVLANK